MIDDALSCHIKKTISPCWRPAKDASEDTDKRRVTEAVKQIQ